MRKSLVLLISVLMLALLMVTFVACVDNTGNRFTLELVEKDKEYFEFTVGEIDWNEIKFYVYDAEDNNLGEYVASESMVVAEDLTKLHFAGTKTIKLVYQGAELYVTLKLNSPVFVPEYTVIFNAGDGRFTNIEGNPNTTTIKGSLLEAIPTPIRDGYEFLGWYEDQNGTGTKIITPYTLKRDLTLYAKWSDQRKYTITYSVYEDSMKREDLPSQTNIEHGSRVELSSFKEKVGFNFDRYEVIDADDNLTTLDYDANQEGYYFEVCSNLQVRLRYVTKMINLTFVSDAWTEGQVVGDVVISGGVYHTQVPYNTILEKNILPIPSLPIKTGYDGVWIDNATSAEPVYTKATVDMYVKAQYTIKKYSMFFYDENENLIEKATRIVEYNSRIDTSPIVPEKVGHNGVWKVTNRGYDVNAGEGELIEYPLTNIFMTDDVHVYASYSPKEFNIKYHYKMDGMSDSYVETYEYKYGDTISAPIDLTQNRIIDEVEYVGYNGKYYEIVWYSSQTLAKEKKITFPVDVVDNADFYYEVVERPYIVDFRLPNFEYLEGVDFNYPPVSVKPGDNVVAPEVIMEGYEVIAWYYDAYAPRYDETTTYSAGEFVYYEGAYYSSLKSSTGILPTNNEYWMVGSNRVWFSVVEGQDTIIPINDFHEYNEDYFYDRAFYAAVDVKQFNVTFKNLNITENGEDFAYDYVTIGDTILVDYATIGLTSIAPTSLTVPTYPGGVVESDFIFEGWYTESEFITLPIDIDTYQVLGDLVLYAKWSDKLVGTDGLIFTPDDESNPTYYTISGYDSNLAEGAHLTLRIPKYHDGKPVIGIDDFAFTTFDKTIFIDEIILPSTLTQIGQNAFTACYKLGTFTIEEGNTAFVVDTNGVLYSSDYTILYSAITLRSNPQLTTFIIPSSVETIIGGAFASVTNLEVIGFNGVSYADGVVSGEVALTSIGDYAFDGCKALTTITLPNSLMSIGKYAFRGAYSLVNAQIDKNNSKLIKVGEGAFSNSRDALSTISNDSGVQYLTLANVLISYEGDELELVIDDSIVAIADGAFNRDLTDNNPSNYQLSKLTIGSNSSLKYIGNDVFSSCLSLTNIYILTDSKVEIEATSFNGIGLNAKLFVTNDLLSDYKADENYLVFGEDNILGV